MYVYVYRCLVICILLKLPIRQLLHLPLSFAILFFEEVEKPWNHLEKEGHELSVQYPYSLNVLVMYLVDQLSLCFIQILCG